MRMALVVVLPQSVATITLRGWVVTGLVGAGFRTLIEQRLLEEPGEEFGEQTLFQ